MNLAPHMAVAQFVALALCGCAQPDVSKITPPDVSHSPLLLQATLQGQAQTVVPDSFLQRRAVGWEYPIMPSNNVAFDVEGSTNAFNWYLILTTNQSPAVWDSTNPDEYVRVGAHWIDPILNSPPSTNH